MQGDDFAKRLLSPVQLKTILLLAHSGWSFDRVLRLTGQGMNGLDNAARASGPTPADAPQCEQFARVSGLLRKLQVQGRLQIGYESQTTELSEPIAAERVLPADVLAAASEGYRFQAVDDGKVVLTGPSQVVVWRIPSADQVTPEMKEVIEALRLEPGRERYEVRLAAAEAANRGAAEGRLTSINIAPRSLMGTLFYLSQAVEVPEKHRRQGLVTTTLDAEGRPFDWCRSPATCCGCIPAPCRRPAPRSPYATAATGSTSTTPT